MPNNTKHFVNKWGNMFGKEDLVTPVGRVQWVYLNEPNAKFGDPKYSCVLLVPKTDENKQAFANILAECQSMSSEKYGKKIPEFKYPPVRDGNADYNDGEGKKGEEYKDCWWIKASCIEPPAVFDAKREDIAPDSIKAGMHCRLLIQPIMFDNGFSYRLKAVQFVKDDGTRYRGAFDPKSKFSAFDTPEEAPQVEIQAEEEAPQQLAMPVVEKKSRKLNVDML